MTERRSQDNAGRHELPPLPTPCAQIGKFLDDCTDVFDATQMRDYADKHASRLLAQKDAKLQRLREAIDSFPEDPNPFNYRAVRYAARRVASLNP